jgi:hypothetical protein
MVPLLAGRLEDPFRLRDESEPGLFDLDAADLQPGATYPGPTDHENGSYRIRQKRGGVIERKLGSLTQFAIADVPHDDRAANATRVLDAWLALGTSGLAFHVNRLGHAWFKEGGEPRFLAAVPGGFLWPDPDGGPVE